MVSMVVKLVLGSFGTMPKSLYNNDLSAMYSVWSRCSSFRYLPGDSMSYCRLRILGQNTYPRMTHLPGNFSLRSLTRPNEIDFMCTAHEIPGHIMYTVDHACNSWAYSNYATITGQSWTLYSCIVSAHVLTYLTNPHHSSKCLPNKCAVLQYAEVLKSVELRGFFSMKLHKKMRNLD